MDAAEVAPAAGALALPLPVVVPPELDVLEELDAAVVEAELAVLFELLDSLELESDLRLSVLYQPDPFRITPTGKISRRVWPPQVGHTRTGSSVTLCRRSKRPPQPPHSYS